MIDDRTAEHVPGCNMAFYTLGAEAGQRLRPAVPRRRRRRRLHLAPAAPGLHDRLRPRRPGLALPPQHGQGVPQAAARLRRRRGAAEVQASRPLQHARRQPLARQDLRRRTDRRAHWAATSIYHGLFGTGLFQTIYRKPASMVAAMLMSIEWHLLAAFVAVLGLALPPLLYVVAAACSWRRSCWRRSRPLQAADAASTGTGSSRPLIAYLHFRQPIARGWARYSVRLKAKVMNDEATRLPARPATAVRPGRPQTPALLEQVARPPHAARQHRSEVARPRLAHARRLAAGTAGTWRSTAAAT